VILPAPVGRAIVDWRRSRSRQLCRNCVTLPFFEYVGQCRHTTQLTTSRRGRTGVHAHLRELLADRIGRDSKNIAVSLKNGTPGIPPDLLAEHVVGTFILVLNWWVDTERPLSPHEIDDLFLTLVGPALSAAARE
jgi:hypothetical protein